MAYIVFVAGESRLGKLVAIAMGVVPTPDNFKAALENATPFELRVLGVEVAAEGLHRELLDRFSPFLMKGYWYRPEPAILEYIEALPKLDGHGPTKRVSLDLEPQDFADLEAFVREAGAKTKAVLLRRALRFYRALHRYQAKGFTIQAFKKGQMVQFPDLDDIKAPES